MELFFEKRCGMNRIQESRNRLIIGAEYAEEYFAG